MDEAPARHAAPALERGHHGARLAADERAAAAAHLQVEAQLAAEDRLAEQAELARLLDGARDAVDGHRVLLAHVHVALARAHREAPMIMPSSTLCGLPSSSASSMNAPGSPSSALQTTYLRSP